jgi:dTDP-4-amino-4,6-dideoxygalactose transaminase
MTPVGDPHIPFNKPSSTGREFEAMGDALQRAHLAADGEYSRRCRALLEEMLGVRTVLLVHSCTAALELSALLLDIAPGDEVIMPSFTFVTTATAFALRGATPTFIDIRPDTLNLDERLIEAAVTDRTRGIVPVHYAGVGCDMEAICAIADTYGLAVVEDAAQGLGASFDGRPLGTFGATGALSFHETKNVTSGHGGALIVNREDLAERSEILRDKGTNRRQFLHGQVDKYTWLDVGSSFAISDLAAAYLWPQLEDSEALTTQRMRAWSQYHERFADVEQAGLVQRPIVPERCQHNAHMYYLILPTGRARDALIKRLSERNINAVFHYIPLHSSPGGQAVGRVSGSLDVTNDMSARLVRLPIWTGMSADTVDVVAETVLTLLPEVLARSDVGRVTVTQRVQAPLRGGRTL